jgi:alanine racemase
VDPFDLRLWEGFKSAGGKVELPCIIDEIHIDSRMIANKALFVALKGEKTDGHHHVKGAIDAGAKWALVKKGWEPNSDLDPDKLLFVDDPLAAFQQIVATYRLSLGAKVIGITGSLGKTLVKDLLYFLVKDKWRCVASPESFNSQIGVPLSLLRIGRNDEVALIEAAISKPNEMASLAAMIQPTHTIFTVAAEEHIDTLGTIETILSEKMQLLFKTESKGWCLIPNDPRLKPHLASIPCRKIFWSKKSKLLPHAEFISLIPSKEMAYRLVFPKKQFYEGTLRAHFSYFLNLLNIAFKAAYLLEVPAEVLLEKIKEYQVELMRTEIFKSALGPMFINASYCSDPQSVERDLSHLKRLPKSQKKTLMFGGFRDSKNQAVQEYRRVGDLIGGSRIDQLILFGQKPFSPLIGRVPPHIEVKEFPDFPTAALALKNQLEPDEILLIKGGKKITYDDISLAFFDSTTHSQCLINLSAMKHNIALFRCHLPPKTRIMAVVKAQGYGTDDVQLARFLESCQIDILGVSYLDEAISLRQKGVSQDIFVLNAAPYEVVKAVSFGFEIGVSDTLMIDLLEKEAERQGKFVKVHLHVDTGMSRFGCSPESALTLAKLIEHSAHLRLEGLMTHFASSDDPKEDAFTQKQIELFRRVIQEGIHPPMIHAANSSAALRFKIPECNMVRIGLSLFGFAASQATKDILPLKLAISLVTRVAGLNRVKEGDTISYGRSYTNRRPKALVAVLPIGYYDGLHRHYSGKGHVLIHGQKAPMVGKICMDYMMVDVTDIPNLNIGDTALIFGRDEHGHMISPEEFASFGNSIPHELISCLGPRIQRIFIHE